METWLFFGICLCGMYILTRRTSGPGKGKASKRSSAAAKGGNGAAEPGPKTTPASTAAANAARSPMEVQGTAACEPVQAPPASGSASIAAAGGEGAAEDPRHRAVALVGELIRGHVPPGTTVVPRETKNYTSIVLDGDPRKWLCRFYLNFKSTRYLELPGKRKQRIENVEEVLAHRETLAEIARERAQLE
jgi:hypothetical protein